jgi:ribosomal protein S18 acetylase RimI-like enzyme
MKIVVSKARPEDARGINNVLYKTWLDTYPNKKYKILAEDIKYMYKGKFSKEAIKEKSKKLASRKKGVHTFIAKYDNKVIGMCGISIEKFNRLGTIYVLPKYQGKGIGKLLWNEAKKKFDPKKATKLSVASYNNNAINFYKKLGFKRVGKIFYDERFKLRNGALIPEINMVLKQ